MNKFPYNAYKSAIITVTDSFTTITPTFDGEDFDVQNLSADYDIAIKFDDGDEITIKSDKALGGTQDFDTLKIKCKSSSQTAIINYIIQGYKKVGQ